MERIYSCLGEKMKGFLCCILLLLVCVGFFCEVYFEKKNYLIEWGSDEKLMKRNYDI